jgi:hypothetical protein
MIPFATSTSNPADMSFSIKRTTFQEAMELRIDKELEIEAPIGVETPIEGGIGGGDGIRGVID